MSVSHPQTDVIYRVSVKMKTIEQIKKEYLEFSTEQADKCKKQIQLLKQEDKDDEANLEKIKLNIYGIYETLIKASEKKALHNKQLEGQEKVDSFCEDFLASFDKIPANWRINYEKAKEYNNVIEFVIEENKLSVSEQLKNHFKHIIK